MYNEKTAERLLYDDSLYGNLKYSIIRGSIYDLNDKWPNNVSGLFNGVPEDVLQVLNNKSYHHLLLNSKSNREKLVKALEKIKPEKVDLVAFCCTDWLFLTDIYCYMDRDKFFEQIPYIHSLEDSTLYYFEVYKMIEGICKLGDCFSRLPLIECDDDVSEFKDQILIMTEQGLKNKALINECLEQNEEYCHLKKMDIKDLEKEGWSVEYVRTLKDIYLESDQMLNSLYAYIEPDFGKPDNQYVLTLKNFRIDKEEWMALGCEDIYIKEVYTYRDDEVTQDQKDVVNRFAKGANMQIGEEAFERRW